MQTESITAPPLAQEPERGFIFYLVMVKQSKMTLQGQPLLNGALAYELASMLAPEFSGRDVYIQPCSAPIAGRRELQRSCDRHEDMVISCRSAQRPGREYLSRMGHLAMYDPRLDVENDGPVVGVTLR